MMGAMIQRRFGESIRLPAPVIGVCPILATPVSRSLISSNWVAVCFRSWSVSDSLAYRRSDVESSLLMTLVNDVLTLPNFSSDRAM